MNIQQKNDRIIVDLSIKEADHLWAVLANATDEKFKLPMFVRKPVGIGVLLRDALKALRQVAEYRED